MTPRQLDELHSIPSGHEHTVMQALKSAGREYAEILLDAYEERLAIITEGRNVEPADISAAWSSTLHKSDLMPTMPKRGETGF